MARPHKPGLDYFPQDTDIFHDRKIKRLLAKFGSDGFLVSEYLKTLIYSDHGYYIQSDENLAFDVAEFLGRGMTEDKVKAIISASLQVGLFDKNQFSTNGILTSAGIQKRYLLAKRKGVIAASMRVIADETQVMTAITPENDAISTQRKEKESKVNESKVKESKGEREKRESTPRALILEKMIKHLEKHVHSYYPIELNKAKIELLTFQEHNRITQERIDAEPATKELNDKEDARIFEKHLGRAMRKEAEKCYDYYAARNFKIDGEAILTWAPVLSGWMNRRQEYKKQKA